MQNTNILNPVIFHDAINYTEIELKEQKKLNFLFKHEIKNLIKKIRKEKSRVKKTIYFDTFGMMRIL